MKVKKMRMLLQKKNSTHCVPQLYMICNWTLRPLTPESIVIVTHHFLIMLPVTYNIFLFLSVFSTSDSISIFDRELCSCAVLGKGKLPRCPWHFWVPVLIHRYLSEIKLMLEKCKIELTCKKRINNEIRLRSEPKD